MSEGVRKRASASSSAADASSSPPPASADASPPRPPRRPRPRPSSSSSSSSARGAEVVCVFLAIVAVSFALSLILARWMAKPWSGIPPGATSGATDVPVYDDELKVKDGEKSAELWLAIAGEVFDVGAGAKHYGPGGSYHGFVARDATRAFVTGKFDDDENLRPGLDGLEPRARVVVDDWLKFYRDGKTHAHRYRRVGVHAGGLYYDVNGAPTKHKLELVKTASAVRKRVEREAEEARARAAVFPNCDARWSAEAGGEVWCPDGTSHPRREVSFGVREDDGTGTGRKTRCACFPDESFSDVRQLYPGCEATATRCKTS